MWSLFRIRIFAQETVPSAAAFGVHIVAWLVALRHLEVL
jgi:hypothetical protein